MRMRELRRRAVSGLRSRILELLEAQLVHRKRHGEAFLKIGRVVEYLRSYNSVTLSAPVVLRLQEVVVKVNSRGSFELSSLGQFVLPTHLTCRVTPFRVTKNLGRD